LVQQGPLGQLRVRVLLLLQVPLAAQEQVQALALV
jgi:hypothetical protein